MCATTAGQNEFARDVVEDPCRPVPLLRTNRGACTRFAENVSQLLSLSTGESVRTSEPPVSQLLGLSTGESERTRSGDLESTAILWIDLDDG